MPEENNIIKNINNIHNVSRQRFVKSYFDTFEINFNPWQNVPIVIKNYSTKAISIPMYLSYLYILRFVVLVNV